MEKDLKSADSSLSSSMESLPSSNGSAADDFVSTSKHEEAIFRGIATNLLPKVGTSVSTLILSASRGIRNNHVRAMLRQLPNVRHVDLSYTNVAAPAFAGLSRVSLADLLWFSVLLYSYHSPPQHCHVSDNYRFTVTR